ncbi:unnamed protein product [Adineta ricciae]|uniref:Uncharacterized protein n=1 Tax=Adineta ricciae TaxID=249248 RepID=A0A815QAK6_ADIRI|nr:unnamed protein product [Adineta ricciae]
MDQTLTINSELHSTDNDKSEKRITSQETVPFVEVRTSKRKCSSNRRQNEEEKWETGCGNDSILITFDELPSLTAVPNGYKSINWNNAYVFINSYNISGFQTGTVSPNCTSHNAYGNPMRMTNLDGTLFTLHSVAMASAWKDNLQLNVVGYRSNVIIANNTYIIQVFLLSNITFIGYSNLDTVVFSTSGGTRNPNVSDDGTHYAMDNLCISVK